MNECTKCIHHPVCKTAESCDGYVSGCKHFVVISNLETTTQTNADRIRAMSDEELANWLEWYVLEVLDFNEIQHVGLEDGEHEHLLEMLKQPADMRGEEDGV